MKTALIIMTLLVTSHARAGELEDELLLQRMATEDVAVQLMIQNQGSTPKTQPSGDNEATPSADELLAAYRKSHAKQDSSNVKEHGPWEKFQRESQ